MLCFMLKNIVKQMVPVKSTSDVKWCKSVMFLHMDLSGNQVRATAQNANNRNYHLIRF